METYIPRFFKSPQQSFFLFGPRGTGKSTFLKSHYKDALWVDLLKPNVFRDYSARPEKIIELVHGNPDKEVVIIDEVQKIPELLSAVHSLIEEKTGKKFVITGSSARKLKRAGIDLLAGRVLLRSMHPFMYAELTHDIALEDILSHGLLPIVIASVTPEDTLNTYTALYIREEVQYEGLVRNISNFTRFLEAISFSHGAVLNVSNVARECQVERKVVESYITILEDILLAFRVPVFTKKAKRNLVAHPKFYFFDSGVYRSLRPKGPLDRPEEIGGAALEGLVAQHLKAWNAYSETKLDLYYWRSRGGLEVDFVLYGDKGFYAIEVKNNSKVRPEDLRALAAFKQDYPECKTLLLYRGKEKLLNNDILCRPCDDFLRNLKPDVNIDD